MMTTANTATMIRRKVVERINPTSSNQKEKKMFFFLLYLYEKMGVS